MDIFKYISLFVMVMTSIPVAQAASPVVRNDSLSVKGFDFSNENKMLRVSDIYGSCYRLEEPLFIRLEAAGHGVAFKKSWVSKVRFTLAQSKVISSKNLRAKNTTDGVTWVDEPTVTIGGVVLGTRLDELGKRKKWTTFLKSNTTNAMPDVLTEQEGWEISTEGVNNNTVSSRVNIPTRNLQTLEFIFTSEANNNDVHIMFERQPGTNYMKNTSIWRPNNGDVVPELETDTGNKLGKGNLAVSSAPYDRFNLVRAERISFKGRQYDAAPSIIQMGVYEVGFKVEPDTEKYGFTAKEFDAACR